ncbi:hypothetical protein [Celeribacter sp. ULVN23_4]
MLKENIDQIFEFITKNQMKVSINASWKMREYVEQLTEIFSSDDNQISADQANDLCRLMNDLRFVIDSEAQEVTAFFPKEKRYNADYLFNNIGAVVGETIFASLPPNAQMDVECAGKSILLEQPTAAAFHIMRACECTLKQLYLSVVKKGRKDPAMWNNMVQHLVERKALDDAQKGTLDIFRKGFRNPTAHPDTFYTSDQAQDLLATTAQLLNQLVTHPRYDREAS